MSEDHQNHRAARKQTPGGPGKPKQGHPRRGGCRLLRTRGPQDPSNAFPRAEQLQDVRGEAGQ
eukprot:8566475-Lingulodinium_polyedra.AAC.1